jgi:hypothetical protein
MGLELGDLFAVDVDDHDIVSQVGKARGCGETHVAGANYSDFAQCGAIISAAEPASDCRMRVWVWGDTRTGLANAGFKRSWARAFRT